MIDASPRTNTHSIKKITGRKLEHLCTNFERISEAVGKLTESDDICLILLHDEQLAKFKHELDDIFKSVLSSDEAEDKELSRQQIEFQKRLFDCLLVVKCFLENRAHPTDLKSSHKGVKLPK